MNTNNVEKTSDSPINTAISEALSKLKVAPEKEGVDLLDITKKLTAKKFGKKT